MCVCVRERVGTGVCVCVGGEGIHRFDDKLQCVFVECRERERERDTPTQR